MTVGAPVAQAALEIQFAATGKLRVSADGSEGGTPSNGPSTSQVEKLHVTDSVRAAFLICGDSFIGVPILDGHVLLDGVPVNWDKTASGISDLPFVSFADVTSIVKPKVDASSPGLVSFQQTETNLWINGCGLYVIEGSVTLLGGCSENR